MKFYAHHFFSTLRIFYVKMATSEGGSADPLIKKKNLVHTSFVSRWSFVVLWFGFGHIGAQLVLPLLVAFALKILRPQM